MWMVTMLDGSQQKREGNENEGKIREENSEKDTVR